MSPLQFSKLCFISSKYLLPFRSLLSKQKKKKKKKKQKNKNKKKQKQKKKNKQKNMK